MLYLSRPKILCVDDKATAEEMRLLRIALERAGYQVLTAKTPSDAISLFRSSNFDLVLTEDIRMTDAHRTLAQTLKSMKPTVPVAIYTGGWGPSPEESRVADRFITKLLTIDELTRAIDSLLSTGQTSLAA